MPGRILAVADGPTGRAGLLYSRHETLARLKPVHGKPAAYVCRNFACSLPVTEPTELASSLDDGSENKAGNDGDAEGQWRFKIDGTQTDEFSPLPWDKL